MGSNGRAGQRPPPNVSAHPYNPSTSTSPSSSRAKMSKDNRGRSAHANGGAAKVKKRFSLAARHRFFGQAPKKWGRMAGQGNDHHPAYRRTRREPRQAPAPSPSRAKMTPVYRGRSAHANGGAAGVKKRLSLAARHRFFGQAPKKWGRKAGQGNDPRPA